MTERLTWDETPEFDDDEWEDYVPSKWSFKRDSDSNGISRLFGLLLLGLTALGIVVATTARFEGGATLWEEFRSFAMRKDMTPYGGIDFGMSPAESMQTRPDMNVVTVAGGEKAGVYEYNGVRFTVGFGHVGGTDKAYRFHSVRMVDTEGADAFLEGLVRRYGTPVETDCGQRIFTQMRFCHFAWLTEGGIALKVSTQPVAGKDNRALSKMTVVARDTFLDGKRRAVPAKARS